MTHQHNSEEDTHSHFLHTHPHDEDHSAGEGYPPRPHVHTHEDELDLERELEMLLQSPMLFSSPDLGLPAEPQYSEASLLCGPGGSDAHCPQRAASPHCATPPPDSTLALIDLFGHPSGDQTTNPSQQHPTSSTPILPLLLPAQNSFATPCPISPPSVSATVTLAHKPRGSHGVWQDLATDQRIRVTKGKGKRLRVEVRSSHRFSWPEVQLGLVDLTDGEDAGRECPDFFVCTDRSTLQDDEDSGGTTAVVEVHVSRVRARLQFHVTLQPAAGGWTWRGQSVPFITHNNGKDRVPRKRGAARGARGGSTSS